MKYDLMEVLAHIDPTRLSYQGWLNVGMALKEEGYAADTWDAWSRRDPARYHANECHYGIITTNGKSLDFQGVSAFVAVYSIPFPKLKYGEKIDEKRRLLH